MASIFAVLAFLIGLFSIVLTSQATAGVWGVGFACLIAILARMGQSEQQHRQLMKKITVSLAPTDAPKPPAPTPTVRPKTVEEAAKVYGVTSR